MPFERTGGMLIFVCVNFLDANAIKKYHIHQNLMLMKHQYVRTALKGWLASVSVMLSCFVMQGQTQFTRMCPVEKPAAATSMELKEGAVKADTDNHGMERFVKSQPWGESADWSEWEYYGKILITLPTLDSFFGLEDRLYTNEQDVYIRKQLDCDGAQTNIPWQIRIDGVFGLCSMSLNYDYHNKCFSVLKMEIPEKVPESMSADLPENFELLEYPYIASYESYGEMLYDSNKFFPESGRMNFGQLSFVYASGMAGTDREGYIYRKTYTPEWTMATDNRYLDWEIAGVDFTGDNVFVENQRFIARASAADGNTLAVRFSCGKNVRGVRYQVVPDQYSYHNLTHNVAHIKDYPDFGGKWPHKDVMFGATEDGFHEISVTLPEDDAVLRINMYPLTADGEVADYGTGSFVFVSTDYGRWEELGEGLLQDRTVAKICTDITDDEWNNGVFSADGRFLLENPTWTVTVERDADTPGRYRVRNPYASSPWLEHIEGMGVGALPFDNYLYFDASDPERVLLDVSVVGLNYSHSVPLVRGYFYDRTWDDDRGQWVFYEEDLDRYTGRLSDNKIILPAFTVIHNNNFFLPWNVSSDAVGSMDYPDVVLTLPGGSALDEAMDDASAPAEYFNLQGMKICSPAAGQTVIVRRGAAVEKVRF